MATYVRSVSIPSFPPVSVRPSAAHVLCVLLSMQKFKHDRWGWLYTYVVGVSAECAITFVLLASLAPLLARGMNMPISKLVD